MKKLYVYIDFFGFIEARNPEESFKLENEKRAGKLASLDKILKTETVRNAEQFYTHADNRFDLMLDENGYLIKGNHYVGS